MQDLKHFIYGAIPVQEEKSEKRLELKNTCRDIRTRNCFLRSFELDKFPCDSKQIYSILNNYDVGHVIELQHGGTNDFKNLVVESKTENREPGLKRQIERENEAMITVGKIVNITNILKFDSRLRIRVPLEWTISQEILHRNGRTYKTETYKMSNQPYLEIVTNRASRGLLVRADTIQNLIATGETFLKTVTFQMLNSNLKGKERLKDSVKTGCKVISPYIGKTLFKDALDFVQTSKAKGVQQDLRETIALVNVNTPFNVFLNNATRIASSCIFVNETRRR